MTTHSRDLDILPPPPSWPCAECPFHSRFAAEVYVHIKAVHDNDRKADVSPNPGRRLTDNAPTTSPWVRQARAGLLPPKRLS